MEVVSKLTTEGVFPLWGGFERQPRNLVQYEAQPDDDAVVVPRGPRGRFDRTFPARHDRDRERCVPAARFAGSLMETARSGHSSLRSSLAVSDNDHEMFSAALRRLSQTAESARTDWLERSTVALTRDWVAAARLGWPLPNTLSDWAMEALAWAAEFLRTCVGYGRVGHGAPGHGRPAAILDK